MTDHDLAHLLERSADRTSVGSPPVPEMLAHADGLRRRRTALRAAVAATSVVAVVGGTALVTAPGTDPAPSPPVDSPAVDLAPPGTRLVGIGHSAIAVPEEWATNALRCGEAEKPTVVIGVTAIEACLWLGAPAVDNVWLEPGLSEPLYPAEDFEIDGVAAQRGPTTCTDADTVDGVEVPRKCTATVYLPTESASYRAEAATEERVEEILSWIRVHPELVALPGYERVNSNHQDDDAGEHYRAALEDAGFVVETVTESQPGGKPGYILGVDPQPGTMAEPGDTVTITEVAEPRGPAEEVSVEVNSVGPGESNFHGLTDAEVRAGATIRIELGATIWTYGSGRRIGTLAGEVSGTALALDDWEEGPNYGHSWVAVERGTSTITITITADGRRVEIGTVTVVVR